jgi:hypothetical protein
MSVSVLLASLTTAPAVAAGFHGWGALCTLVSTSDPTADRGTETGVLVAGPLVLDDGDTPPGLVNGHVVCTVQVNEERHSGTNAATVTGVELPEATAAAGTVSYRADWSDTVYVCTAVVIGGQTWYYDEPNNGVDLLKRDRWLTTPNAECGLATDTNADALTPVMDLVDAVVCPVLALVFPPEGDVAGVWDCPPYEDGSLWRRFQPDVRAYVGGVALPCWRLDQRASATCDLLTLPEQRSASPAPGRARPGR